VNEPSETERIEWGGYDVDTCSDGDVDCDSDGEDELWKSCTSIGDSKVSSMQDMTTWSRQTMPCDSNSLHLMKQARIHEFEHGRGVISACFSSDGRNIATGFKNSFVRIFDVATGTEILKTVKHRGCVVCVCFSFDGRKIATVNEHDCVRLFDIDTGKLILKISNSKHRSVFTSVCFSPVDGKRIATGTDSGLVQIFDISSGDAVLKINKPFCEIKCLCYSPDGTMIATGSVDSCVRIFEVATGKETKRLVSLENGKIKYGGSVLSICFSPEGNSIVTGSGDKFARVFDVVTGMEILKTAEHGHHVTSVCFSRDGKCIATGSVDNWALSIATGYKKSHVRIFQVATGAEILKTEEQRGYVLSLSFSSDGSKIATATEHNFARIFDLANSERSSLVSARPVPRSSISECWIREWHWEEVKGHQYSSTVQSTRCSSVDVKTMVEQKTQNMCAQFKENELARDHIIKLLSQYPFLDAEVAGFDAHDPEGRHFCIFLANNFVLHHR
jgi:WD40 repeat protein